MNLRRIRSVFGGVGNRLKLARLGRVADIESNAHGFEVGPKRLHFLGCGAFVHPKQPRVLALRNKVRAAQIGRQHRLFNQLVRHVAGARHDLFNAAVLVAHDLRLGGLKVHRATALARLEQRLVHTVQIEQIPHQGFAFLRFRSPRIAQNGRDLVVGESRMAPHHRRIELVGADLAIKRHEHIAHHAQAL